MSPAPVVVPTWVWLVVAVVAVIVVATVITLSWADRRARRQGGVFLRALVPLNWGEGQPSIPQLDKVVGAFAELAARQINYYRRYRWRSTFAISFRAAAWLLGSAGILCPLLAAARRGAEAGAPLQLLGQSFDLVASGYVLLALAGAFLAANRLLGLTHGHIRLVTAHLKLQNLVDQLALEYARWKAAVNGTPSTPQCDEAFALLERTRLAIVAVIEAETADWAAETVRQEDAFQALVRDRSAAQPSSAREAPGDN